MDPSSLLSAINRRHGTAFALGARFRHGEQGAYAVVGQGGTRAVLKWSDGAAAMEAASRATATVRVLRGAGYPAPRYLLVGTEAGVCFWIQEALPGVPMHAATGHHVERLIALNALQVGRATAGGPDWAERIIRPVLAGGDDGYCRIESLQTYSATTAALLASIQTFVTAHRTEAFETRDIVHFDFNPLNILVDAGQVSGVIDWEGTCAGDSAFDLATLLFYAYEEPGVRERLWRAAGARANPGTVGVYLANLIARQLDWSIRHHSEGSIRYWIDTAHTILGDLRAR